VITTPFTNQRQIDVVKEEAALQLDQRHRTDVYAVAINTLKISITNHLPRIRTSLNVTFRAVTTHGPNRSHDAELLDESFVQRSKLSIQS
jgi:hypothetical protein